MVYGENMADILRNTSTMQNIYDNDYSFAKPPLKPTMTAVPGDNKVTLYWNNFSYLFLVLFSVFYCSFLMVFTICFSPFRPDRDLANVANANAVLASSCTFKLQICCYAALANTAKKGASYRLSSSNENSYAKRQLLLDPLAVMSRPSSRGSSNWPQSTRIIAFWRLACGTRAVHSSF